MSHLRRSGFTRYPTFLAYKHPPIILMNLMRISEIKLHSIAIADPPLRSSYGLHAQWALRTIVELETDDGISGERNVWR
jgi:hypothetical protein